MMISSVVGLQVFTKQWSTHMEIETHVLIELVKWFEMAIIYLFVCFKNLYCCVCNWNT